MSYSQKGFKDGVNKRSNRRPKSDGFLGTSIGQSDKNRNAQKSYDKGYNSGNKKRRGNMNGLQKLFD